MYMLMALNNISKICFNIGITLPNSRLASINADGTAVNAGIHNGLGVKFKEPALLISIIHCFSYGFELAVKDTFDVAFFKDIDKMLLKFY